MPGALKSSPASSVLSGWISTRTAPRAPIAVSWVLSWLAALAAGLSRGRSHLSERAAVFAGSTSELQGQLARIADGAGQLRGARGRPLPGRGLVWVFTGMGPQTWTMGRELYASDDVFRAAWDEVNSLFGSECGWSLDAAMSAGVSEFDTDSAPSVAGGLVPNYIAQCANFALQVALTRTLREWAVPMDAVVGHSVGEVAAAVAVESLSLADGVRLIHHRAQTTQKVVGHGRLLAVGCGPDHPRVIEACNRDGISIAAFNASDSVALVGAESALADIAGVLDEDGIFNRLVAGEVPYHSPFIEPLREEFLSGLKELKPHSPTRLLCSSVTGDFLSEPQDGEYWWRNMRQPVEFRRAMDTLVAWGGRHFLQIGPQPVLTTAIVKSLSESECEGVALGTLNFKQAEAEAIERAISELYVHGVALDFDVTCPGPRTGAQLPGYAWQRQRLWSESAAQKAIQLRRSSGHPMLEEPIPSPSWGVRTELDRSRFGYMRHHRVSGEAIVPGAAYVEAGLAAYFAQYERQTCVLRNLVFESPLALPDGEVPQLYIDSAVAGESFSVHSESEAGVFRRHAHGEFVCDANYRPRPDYDLAALQLAADRHIGGSEFYAALAERGYAYGRLFQTVAEAWYTDDTAIGRIAHSLGFASDRVQYLHPAVLDGALQVLVGLPCAGTATFVPASIREVRFFRSGFDTVFCVARVTESSDEMLVADVDIVDAEGAVMAELRGVQCRLVGSAATDQVSAEGMIYARRREAVEVIGCPAEAGESWLVLVPQAEKGEAVGNALLASGAQSVAVHAIGEAKTIAELVHATQATALAVLLPPLTSGGTLPTTPSGFHGVSCSAASFRTFRRRAGYADSTSSYPGLRHPPTAQLPGSSGCSAPKGSTWHRGL